MTNNGSDDAHDNQAGPVNPNRPPQIRSEHLRKLALIYVRQATVDQAQEEAEHQRRLAEMPRRWGWSSSLIKVIEDLGRSGTSRRPGFQEMLGLINGGKVGIVLVREVSRLSRNPLDLQLFLTACFQAGVLVVVNGRVMDPATEFSKLFLGLWARWEKQARVQIFGASKRARSS